MLVYVAIPLLSVLALRSGQDGSDEIPEPAPSDSVDQDEGVVSFRSADSHLGERAVSGGPIHGDPGDLAKQVGYERGTAALDVGAV